MALPKHVHRVTKSRKDGGKTTYTFYTRGRNTENAWPSIRLPDPLTNEFNFHLAICDQLSRDDKGFLLGGKRLPPYREPNFWVEAEKAFDALMRQNRLGIRDFRALVEAFQSETNAVWRSLSASTRRGYSAYGKLIIEIWGNDMPTDLTTVDAQEAIDSMSETPAAANQFRAYLSRLMAWGIPRGFCMINPVSHTEKIPGGEPWTPWPDWAFETLFRHAPSHLQMIAVSAFFTGQRQGDVLRMKRPLDGETTIEVKAQKTKRTVWIPLHSEYRKWIERMPADAVQLHVGARGLPFRSADGFRTEWQKLMRRDEFTRFREERIVFHGLRKNAVINLLEVGCTENQVGAICNMSPQMVQHYGREVSLRSLARDAMHLMESRWADIEPAAFRNKNRT
ncbi:hypothetical protein TM49_16100 [Martelella endophytica]|uniref:Core-binding (CB) domain-containing protein n=1 Tax=Martelella endophytica TaxID=1486262 RepID=A0A0D5LXU3_MAREN|nr:hypothetical protein TM49_16100 [Martelella endophytica]